LIQGDNNCEKKFHLVDNLLNIICVVILWMLNPETVSVYV